MDFGIGWIFELLWDEITGVGGGHLLSSLDSTGHSLTPRREDQLCTVRPQQQASFHAHSVRHRQYALVAACRTNERQGDAGITARRLQNDGVWPN